MSSCAASPFVTFGRYCWVNKYTISYFAIDPTPGNVRLALVMTNGDKVESDMFDTGDEASDWVEKNLMPKTE